MTERATFTLEPEVYAFLNSVGGDNRSAYINKLLKEEKKRMMAKAILAANQKEAEDAEYQDELADWDASLKDGL